MSKAKVWMTKALYSTHKKATSKSASEAYGIDFLQCNSQDLTTQICNSCFRLPILFTYKGAGI